ncbi:MAG: hypothetical protein J0G35_08580 [Acidobacteriales bacterium]|nr:hypothetical protein [Terriglobales bacterium]
MTQATKAATTLEFPKSHSRKTHAVRRRNPDCIFDVLREIGVNKGMVEMLEIYNEAGGEQTVNMFEEIFKDQLEDQIVITLQELARRHGGEYQTLYDRFMSIAW